MKMISLFRTPKPKQFQYTPIFYDERKEKLKGREQQLKQELGIADANSPRVSGIRGQIRRQIRTTTQRTSAKNYRLVAIIVALTVIAYLLLFS